MKTRNCTECGEKLLEHAHFCRACGAKGSSGRKREKRRAKTANNPWIFMIGGGMLLLIVGIWSVSAKPAPTTSLGDIEDQHSESGIPYPEVNRATADEVKLAVDEGSGLIVDVRSAAEYQEEHIPGAISIPLTEMERRLQELPLEQMIYLYCTWPSEESSARAASFLSTQGYENVAAILGGLQAWENAGFPISTGSEPGAINSQYEGEQSTYTNISVEDLQGMLENKDFLLVNVHIPLEGNIPQTDITIPFDDIPSNLDLLPADKNEKILLYCKGNSMSRSASEELIELGYTNVFNLDGGYTAWKEAGLPFKNE